MLTVATPYTDTLLNVTNLKVAFRTDDGDVEAVNGVSFTVRRGKTLGIVGESGSGKSVCAKAIMQLLPNNAVIDPASSIALYGPNGEMTDTAKLKPTSREMRQLRGRVIAMIFQEPMSSFSPVYTIGDHITEAILAHQRMTKREARGLAIDMLDKVGISNPSVRVDQYPFELSGGMRQRAMIAVALSLKPSLLIADEPTTALDVTIQAQILGLIRQLQAELGMAIIFITHDLGVIAQVTDEIAVTYLGHIVEYGTTREVIRNPKHPYTQGLLNAIPKLDELETRLIPVGGEIPSPLERPNGCAFHTRCSQRIAAVCDARMPARIPITNTHSVNCFLYDEVATHAAP